MGPAQDKFNELNEGLQQRLMLARAIAQNTPVLLLDEPASAQDNIMRVRAWPSRVALVALLWNKSKPPCPHLACRDAF